MLSSIGALAAAGVSQRIFSRGAEMCELIVQTLRVLGVAICALGAIGNSGGGGGGDSEEMKRVAEQLLQLALHALDCTMVPPPAAVMAGAAGLVSAVATTVPASILFTLPSMVRLKVCIVYSV
jgi:hypothetical protein